MLLNNKITGVQVQKILIIVIVLKIILSEETFLESTYDKDVREDAHLNTEQLLQKYNYPVETHYVESEDDYVLCLHRIPNPNGQPVFLMHGLLDSSAGWILLRPNISLGCYLFDNGYDVWMGNARGNRYSRNHTYLDPNTDDSFWKFSWHEIGVYDLPAMIDYTLDYTGYSKLVYFGHSQGTTVFFVLCSMRPEYNEKILIMHALAPVAYCSHIRTPLLNSGRLFLKLLGDNEFPIQSKLLYRYCLLGPVSRSICINIINGIMGPERNVIDYDKYLPMILGHAPAGAGIKQMKHYAQLVDSGKFAQYDFGTMENKNLYGRRSPPDYNIKNITAPIALYYAYNDYLSTVLDVKRLISQLRNVVEDHLYPYKKWNHISVTWGKLSRKLAHKRMLELTNQVTSKKSDKSGNESSIWTNIVPGTSDYRNTRVKLQTE